MNHTLLGPNNVVKYDDGVLCCVPSVGTLVQHEVRVAIKLGIELPAEGYPALDINGTVQVVLSQTKIDLFSEAEQETRGGVERQHRVWASAWRAVR